MLGSNIQLRALFSNTLQLPSWQRPIFILIEKEKILLLLLLLLLLLIIIIIIIIIIL
jgi:hypothetical protein